MPDLVVRAAQATRIAPACIRCARDLPVQLGFGKSVFRPALAHSSARPARPPGPA